jgi:excisionase family DNA binding protein
VCATLDVPREFRSVTLSVHDTACLLGVSPQLIYAMVNDGRLPALRVGSRVLLRRETVQRLLGDPMPIADDDAGSDREAASALS